MESSGAGSEFVTFIVHVTTGSWNQNSHPVKPDHKCMKNNLGTWKRNFNSHSISHEFHIMGTVVPLCLLLAFVVGANKARKGRWCGLVVHGLLPLKMFMMFVRRVQP